MSSYTAQLFESLRRAASPEAANAPGRQLNFSFSLPPQGSGTIAPAPTPSGDKPATLNYSSSVGTGSLLSPLGAPRPSSLSPSSSDNLPNNLDECHAIIQYQRNQIAQWRARVSTVEDQLTQYRETAMAAELGTAQGATAYASKQHADELASLRSTIEAQTHEIGKLRDERAGLMKRLMDQQKKLEETKVDSEREKQELAYKLGKETALAALGASQTLSSGAANAVPTSPFRLTDAPSAVPSVRRGAGLRLGAQEKETKEEAPAESSTAALLRELNLEPKADHATGSAPTGVSDVAATLETTTNSLLAKQEQLKQQELLLQALKQQQVQNRVLSAQAQRLQHQVHANHPPAQFASPRGASGPGFSPMGRYGAPHTGPAYGYNAGPTVSPTRAAYHPIGAGPSSYGSGGYGALGPSGMGHSARNVHSYGAAPANNYGASPHYAAPPPPPHPYGASPQMYGAPADTRRRLSLRDYSNSQDVAEYGAPEVDAGPQMLPPPGSPVSQAPAYFPPPGGWTVYMHPPEGTKWPDTMAFFRPLVDTGIPVIKHGRMGRPHKRLMWLDITSPGEPVLVWQEGEQRNPAKIKEKDRLPLIEIEDIKAGQVSTILQRSGSKNDSDKYMSFTAENRTLDIEAPTPEGRDFLFKKFADLFQAYATAQREKLIGDDITLRVADIMDNGADAAPQYPEPEMSGPPQPRGRSRSPGPDGGYYGGGGPSYGHGGGGPQPYGANGGVPYGSGGGGVYGGGRGGGYPARY